MLDIDFSFHQFSILKEEKTVYKIFTLINIYSDINKTATKETKQTLLDINT